MSTELSKTIPESKVLYTVTSNGITVFNKKKLGDFIKDEKFINELHDHRYITNWEHKFLSNIKMYDKLSEKQTTVRDGICKKLQRYVIDKKNN